MASMAGPNQADFGGILPPMEPPPPPPLLSSSSNGSNKNNNGKNSGKNPKRVRRKCSHGDCDNRVVQGGVCVTHGARRKGCAHPGCDKAVKLAGYCSAHGPSRRKCDEDGCGRVAVQGGRCLSHGARRRICNYPAAGGRGPCGKNAIAGGMCKKHHDRMADARGMLDAVGLCVPCDADGMGGGEMEMEMGNSVYYSGSGESVEGGSEVGSSASAATNNRATAYQAWGGDGASANVGASPPDPLIRSEGESEVAPMLVSMAATAAADGRYGYHQAAASQQHHRDYGDYYGRHHQQDPADAFQDHHRGDPSAYQGYPHQDPPAEDAADHGGYYYRQQQQQQQPPPPPPPLPAYSSRPPPAKRARHQSGHQRGLSIFEDMSTVDAIISSGQTENRHAATGGSASWESSSSPPAPPPSSFASHVHRRQSTTARAISVSSLVGPSSSSSSSSINDHNDAMSTNRTPTAQVSFADSCFPRRRYDGGGVHRRQRPPPPAVCPPTNGGLGGGGAGSDGGDSSPPCTGNSSCTCNACRSPTLAIFEQMIQASQKLENGEVDPAKYAGLSPPRLSPRKSSAAAVAAAERRPSDVVAVGAPAAIAPGAVGSVLRMVSSNNIVEEAGGASCHQQDRGSYDPVAHRQPQDHQGGGGPHQRPVYRWEAGTGPASHALAAASPPAAGGDEGVDADSVGRTISDDVDDGQYRRYRDAPWPPHPPPTSLPRQHHDPHSQGPLTPKLTDNGDDRHRGGDGVDASDPLAVVSSHSSNYDQTSSSAHHHSSPSLLPRQRQSIEHLFIPS